MKKTFITSFASNQCLLLSALLVFLAGCSTQARNTYNTFQESNDYVLLYDSMEAAQDAGRDSTLREQFAAVRELRYMAKYESEPGKREMAARALVSVGIFTDDGDVSDRLLSRANAIVESDEYPFYLKQAVLEAYRDVVIGRLGYRESGIFGGEKEFITPDSGEREDALDELMDFFPDAPLDLQFVILETFDRIFADTVADKEDLVDEFLDWLEDKSLSPAIKQGLIELAYIHNLPLEKWQKEEEFEPAVAKSIAAVLERKKLYGNKVNNGSVPKAATSVKTILGESNEFLSTHLEDALFQQAFSNGKPEKQLVVPIDLVVVDYKETEADKQRQYIIARAVIRALSLGMALAGDPQGEKLLKTIQASKDTFALTLNLKIAQSAMAGFGFQKEKPEALIKGLATGVTDSNEEHRKRYYLQTLASANLYFPAIAGPLIEQVKPNLNIRTAYLAQAWGVPPTKPVKPLTLATKTKAKQIILALSPPPGPEPHPASLGKGDVPKKGTSKQPEPAAKPVSDKPDAKPAVKAEETTPPAPQEDQALSEKTNDASEGSTEGNAVNESGN